MMKISVSKTDLIINFFIGLICAGIALALWSLIYFFISAAIVNYPDKMQFFWAMTPSIFSLALFFSLVSFRLFQCLIKPDNCLFTLRSWQIIAIIMVSIGLIGWILSSILFAVALPTIIAFICMMRDPKFSQFISGIPH
jgi:hypothetical protein